jgi:hypothetical protein
MKLPGVIHQFLRSSTCALLMLCCIAPAARADQQIPALGIIGAIVFSPVICTYLAVAGVFDKSRNTCTRSGQAKQPTPEEVASYQKQAREIQQRADAEEKGYIKDAESIPLCLRTGVNECGYPVKMEYCWQKPKEVDSYWDHTDNFCQQTGDISTGILQTKAKLNSIDRPYRRVYEARDSVNTAIANANFVLMQFCYQEDANTLKCVEASQIAASGSAADDSARK